MSPKPGPPSEALPSAPQQVVPALMLACPQQRQHGQAQAEAQCSACWSTCCWPARQHALSSACTDDRPLAAWGVEHVSQLSAIVAAPSQVGVVADQLRSALRSGTWGGAKGVGRDARWASLFRGQGCAPSADFPAPCAAAAGVVPGPVDASRALCRQNMPFRHQPWCPQQGPDQGPHHKAYTLRPLNPTHARAGRTCCSATSRTAWTWAFSATLEHHVSCLQAEHAGLPPAVLRPGGPGPGPTP